MAVIDLPDWVHDVVRIKNYLLIGLLVLIVVGAIIDENRRRSEDE